MLVIEFLGAPYSGKSYYKDIIEKDIFFRDYKVYDYKQNFFCNYNNIKNLNIIQKFIIKLYCKKPIKNIKKKPGLIKKKSFIITLIQNEINKLIKYKSDSFQKKNYNLSKLVKDYLKNLKETKERHTNLNRWINELFASYEILSSIKSSNKIIIDSEGFIHRLNSLIMSSNKKHFIKSYLSICPKPDILIYVDEDLKVINERIKNSENHNDIKKYKHNLQNIHNNSEIIYKEIKKFPIKLFILNSKNFEQVKNEIIKYLKFKNR